MKFLKYYNASISNALIYGYSEKFKVHPKIMQLIVSRGFKTESEITNFLYPSKQNLHNPFLLKDMDRFVDKVKKAILNKKKILIFGDYDVDGVSACAIMIKTFEKLNYNVDYYLPNRYIDGYGLTNEILDKIKTTKSPDLIITVDCGISCFNEVEYAKKLGIEVIVTDHHEIPEVLPDCICLNAKIENQNYPFSGLCGTGLAFKISQALLGDGADEFLPIAAIATIADIVPLLDENRAIVKLGMKLFDKFLPLGIKALIKEQKISLSNISSTDISFKIAPKLNASGRMGDAEDSLLLYLEKNPIKIKQQIAKILAHNAERQKLCNSVYEDCKKRLECENVSKLRSFIMYDEKWDQGILGIVCARLLEEYNRPVFLFSKIGNMLKGSARSLPDINVHLLLSNLSNILETFGGHTVAAGLSLDVKNFNEFKKRVNSYIFQNINDKAFMPIQYYDLEISEDEVNLDFVKNLSLLEPFGCENQSPKFKIETNKLSILPMKNCPNHANLNFNQKLSLVYFNFLKDQYKLKYAKNKSVIFEFQKSDYKIQRGIVKEFNCDFELEEKNIINLESFILSQLENIGDHAKKFEQYDKEKFLKIVSNLSLSVFGTAIVFYSEKSLNEFLNNYNIENIYNFELGENLSGNGFNSILFCPKGIEWSRNYENIVFYDGILEQGFLSKINSISSAKIYIPKNKKFDTKIFNTINASRENFAKIYSVFKKLTNIEFFSLQSLYSEFCKHKINFVDFYFAFLIFKELKFIELNKKENGFILTTTTNKSELSNSKIYAFVDFIKKTVKGGLK